VLSWRLAALAARAQRPQPLAITHEAAAPSFEKLHDHDEENEWGVFNPRDHIQTSSSAGSAPLTQSSTARPQIPLPVVVATGDIDDNATGALNVGGLKEGEIGARLHVEYAYP